MTEFFDMGGYAAFIWPSWIIGAVVLAAITIISIQHDRSVKAQLAKLDAMDQAQKSSKKSSSSQKAI